MPAFDHLDREFFEVELFAAADRRQLALIDSRGHGNIDRGSRAKHPRAEALGNYRYIGDVVGVAVTGENEVGLGNDSGNFIVISFPLDAISRLAPGKKWVDEDRRGADSYFPAGRAQPFYRDGVCSLSFV